MICPYCNNKIPDGSTECFVCGEDLLPKATSEYYMDMDVIKDKDEKLYDNVAKQVGIETKKKMTDGQIVAMIITSAITLLLILITQDVFKLIQYKSSSLYEKKHAIISAVHAIPYSSSADGYISIDCEVVYEFNGELRYELVKSGFHYRINDALSIYVDMDGNPYHFVFSPGDLLQLIIIFALAALTFIAIIKWHVMPNADGHLNRQMPVVRMMERRNPGLASRNDKWWRYF